MLVKNVGGNFYIQNHKFEVAYITSFLEGIYFLNVENLKNNNRIFCIDFWIQNRNRNYVFCLPFYSPYNVLRFENNVL